MSPGILCLRGESVYNRVDKGEIAAVVKRAPKDMKEGWRVWRGVGEVQTAPRLRGPVLGGPLGGGDS